MAALDYYNVHLTSTSAVRMAIFETVQFIITHCSLSLPLGNLPISCPLAFEALKFWSQSSGNLKFSEISFVEGYVNKIHKFGQRPVYLQSDIIIG